jgi:hypothetical protein
LREITRGVSPEQQGVYEFEYQISGKFHENCLYLHKLDDPSKVYDNSEIAHITKNWLPQPNSIWLDGLLKTAGLTEYDEWEWLKYFGKVERQHDAFLYENLPEDVIRYDQ